MTRLADFTEERIDKALGAVADAGRSPRTVNVYRRDAHTFGEWAVGVAKLLQTNPVERIAVRNESADRRKERRALTVDEAYRLLDASGRRRMFYTLQLWTGLRVNEARNLEWRDLLLDDPRPSMRLRAATTKAKRADELPLHSALAADLLNHRPADAQPGDRVFKSAPILRTFKNDLEAISIYIETGFRHIMNGEIGRYESTRFCEQTHIPKGGAVDSTIWDYDTADGWDNGKSDWAFFLGSDTVAEAVVIPEEIRGRIPTDLGRSRGIGWYYLGGFGIVHGPNGDVKNARIVKWDSAA